MTLPKFSILITTKNRLEDLKITLRHISHLIKRNDVECIVCDDNSTDGTSKFIESNYKSIELIKNTKNRGYIFNRNRLLNLTKASYAITLDDDAHIVAANPLEIIEHFFQSNSTCAVIAFRIFWGKKLPENLSHSHKNKQVKGFVGCGHAWRMEAWRSVPNYPDWFVFYGEEEFASFQLFKNNWEVWFIPDILVHHRVVIKDRKQLKDYITRLRHSLRSGWYLYFLFYPLKTIPYKLAYSIWIQIKAKVLKGDFKALIAMVFSIFDLLYAIPKIIKKRNRLSKEEYLQYQKITQTEIYWKPKK